LGGDEVADGLVARRPLESEDLRLIRERGSLRLRDIASLDIASFAGHLIQRVDLSQRHGISLRGAPTANE
jgi:hypothetical protein